MSNLNCTARIPTEVLANIFSFLPTGDRHDHRDSSPQSVLVPGKNSRRQQHMPEATVLTCVSHADQVEASAVGLPSLARCVDGAQRCMAEPVPRFQHRKRRWYHQLLHLLLSDAVH